MRFRRLSTLVILLLLTAPVGARAEVIELMNGERIVGKVKDVFGGGGDDKPAPRRPTAQPAQRGAPAKANVPIDADELKAAQRLWILFWRTLVSAASRGTDAIQREFRQMRIATSRSADSMYRAVRGSLADIEHSFEVRGARLVASWGDTWQSIKKLTFDGLNYIGHESNKALKGFGAKTVNFGLSAPPATGKAGGGWIGQKGQRGRDMGLYALGAGEAVLNWGHQKYVEPAMHAFWGFGLSDMFDRTGGTQLMTRIRRLFNRAQVDQNEVNILRGILTAVQGKRRVAGSKTSPLGG